MSELIRQVDPSETGRLTEIGELTALAYLADGLVDQAHPYIPRLRDAHVRAEEAELLVLVDGSDGGGKAAGTITVVPPGSSLAELAQPDEFELRMLAVSPMERGRGIGATLTRYAMERAVAEGARRLVLSTMESMHAAHRLYERVGFTRRPDLDWTVVDNPDGSISSASTSAEESDPAPDGAVRLLGYSWEP